MILSMYHQKIQKQHLRKKQAIEQDDHQFWQIPL